MTRAGYEPSHTAANQELLVSRCSIEWVPGDTTMSSGTSGKSAAASLAAIDRNRRVLEGESAVLQGTCTLNMVWGGNLTPRV